MRTAVAGRRATWLALLPLLGSPAAASDWDRYEVVLWHDHGPAALAAAQRLGVTASAVFGVRDRAGPEAIAAELTRRARPARAAGLGLYVENIATDYYAAYHRWQPDHPVTWLFDRARARFQADRTDPAAFSREPGLSDPAAFAPIAARLRAQAQALGTAPLFYNLGDETGIADLTAAWDFDFAPAALEAFRDWLRGQYGTLDALAAAWGSRFATWDAVRPDTTDMALARTDGNFAAWCDFKTWMDAAFADALRAGTEAVHGAVPAARSGIEGAQVPGWGGYDYTRLAEAVDVMEITDAEQARRIAQAMNPQLVTLQTVTGADATMRHSLWRAVLDGARGAVLWDPDAAIVRPDGAPGPNGQALAPLFAELAGPVGQALVAARPEPGPVAILYSPASFRLRWLLDRRAEAAQGRDWAQRVSETELEDNAWRAALRQSVMALDRAFLMPRFVSPAMLAAGTLSAAPGHPAALLLPHALALSLGERSAIRAFAEAGGLVLADLPPGAYDAHGRPAAPLVAGVTLLPALTPEAVIPRLTAAGIAPAARLTTADGAPAGNAVLRVLKAGSRTLLAVQREAPTADAATPLVLELAQAAKLRDLRTGQTTQAARRWLALDGVAPVVLEWTGAAGGTGSGHGPAAE